MHQRHDGAAPVGRGAALTLRAPAALEMSGLIAANLRGSTLIAWCNSYGSKLAD
jgi:hypothetical protein